MLPTRLCICTFLTRHIQALSCFVHIATHLSPLRHDESSSSQSVDNVTVDTRLYSYTLPVNMDER